MSHEIENIEHTPKQTEFTITLPDREKQWEKCPAFVTKTKVIRTQVTEVIDGLEVAGDPVEREVVYTEMAMEDTGVVGEHGETRLTVVKLSDIVGKVAEAVSVISGKGGKLGSPVELSAVEQKKQVLSEALVASFADEEGVIDEQKLKEKASWGLGCPANCGDFRSFSYAEMVPQSYKCPVCGVTIFLV
jgi:hypothetical protein